MAKSSITKLERGLVELFFKTIGAEVGFFDFKTRAFRAGVESEGLYQENLKQIRAALKEMVAADLEQYVRERYVVGDRAPLLSDVLGKQSAPGRIGYEADLLERLERPLHPALFFRVMPTFAVSESGMVPVGQGKILPKAEFTLRNLIEYYFSRVHVAPLLSRQELGPWNWVLQQADLNELLFAIDAAGEQSTAEAREITPFGLVDFLPQARSSLAVMRARQGEGNPQREGNP